MNRLKRILAIGLGNTGEKNSTVENPHFTIFYQFPLFLKHTRDWSFVALIGSNSFTFYPINSFHNQIDLDCK